MHSENTHGSRMTSRVAASSRRDWLNLVATVGIALLIVGGGWMSMVYLLKTPNPITYVTGTSMLPNLREGDLVILRGTTAARLAEDFEAGERAIIVYRSPVSNIPIIHRVVAVKYDSAGNVIGFNTQGDNVPIPDMWMGEPLVVKETDIVGRVAYHIPYLGFLVIFFSSTAGRITSGAIIALLVIWMIVDEKKRMIEARGEPQRA